MLRTGMEGTAVEEEIPDREGKEVGRAKEEICRVSHSNSRNRNNRSSSSNSKSKTSPLR